MYGMHGSGRLSLSPSLHPYHVSADVALAAGR